MPDPNAALGHGSRRSSPAKFAVFWSPWRARRPASSSIRTKYPGGSLEQDLWWEQPLNLSPDALIWIGAGEPAWGGIGNRVLRSAGVEEEDRETFRSTYLEIVTQVLSGLAP